MLTNNTISIKRLTGTGKRTWEEVESGIEVYMNQINEDLVWGLDAQPSFIAYRMMTDGQHEIIGIGDRVVDDEYTYDVRTVSVQQSIVWESHQYILTRPFVWISQ